MSHPIIRFLDRAKETTSTTGTGTITLGGAVAGFVAIGGIGDGNSTYYTITEGNEFEVGIGTYTSSGNTLSRDQVFASSNAGNKITLAGSATIFITYPADKTVAKTSGNYVGIGIDPEYQLQVSGTGSFNTVRWADGSIQTTAATGTTSYTAGTGLNLVGTTFNASGATTSNQGIVQLQDSLSTSTTTAITPNAVNTASGNLQSSIDTNTTNIATNVTNIAATGATNAAAIATNVTNIATNATNIAATGATNAAAIATNTTNIATNATDIATNTTNIAATGATNAAAIATNTTNIATNTTNIAATGATNAAAIATNTTNIATNTTNIAATGATNAAAIATNATDIATNTTNIAATGATNAAAIATNTTNISTNTTNIAATGATNAAAIAVNADDIDTVSGLLGPAGNNTTLQFNDGGAYGGDNNLTWNKTSKVLTLSGTLDSSPTGSAGGGIYYTHLGGKNGTATLTVTVASKTSDHPHHGAGSSDAFFIDGKESPAITLYPNISYKFDQADGTNGGHPLRFYYDAAKTTAYTTNVTTNGTAGSAGAYTQIEVVGGTGTPSQLFYQCSSHAYMGNYTVQNTTNLNSNVAVSNENGFLYTLPTADASLSGYVLTSNADGTTKWAEASGGGPGGGGAPTNAEYVTLAVSASLSDERVLVVGTGLQLTDGGANSNVTVDASGATTSNIGVVQLQDSATDGTVDKAITPNAVYDVSGVLQTNIDTNTTNIASTGATNAAAIATNVTNIATNATNIAATGATNAAAIVVNTTNIAATGATNAAAIATNATNISTNTTNIAATGATNAAAIATNTTNIATNATNIAATGATNAAAIATNTTNISTNTTNIAATGATNAADIVTVSGIAVSKDNYQYWTSTDGSNNANIETTDTVKYTGAGTVTVSLASGSPSVVTISGSPHDGSGAGGVPGGSDTNVQFNDGGSFSGVDNFTFTKAGSGILKVGTIVTNDADAGRIGVVSIGSGAYTTNYSTVAIGDRAAAKNTMAIAIGRLASSEGVSSIAIGDQATAASASHSTIAIGESATASANRAVAIGKSSTAGQESLAVGTDSDANGLYTTAIGFNADAGATAAVAVGNASIAAERSVALGMMANAGTYGVAIGQQTVAPTSGLVIGAAADNSILSGLFNSSSSATNGYLLTSTKFGINRTSAPDAMLDVTNQAATDVGAIIQGAASQTADLTQWQNSAGTTLASMGMTTSNDRATLMVSGTIVSNVADASRIGVVSIGSGAYSTQNNSVAIGKNAWTNSSSAVVMGAGCKVDSATAGVAIGGSSYSLGSYGIAIGYLSYAHQESVCIGYGANYSNHSSTRSVFINSANPADNNADGVIGIGYRAHARGPKSVSIGHEVNYNIGAHDGNDVAIGNYTKSEAYGIAFGYQASAPTSGLVIGAAADNSILSGQFNSSTSHTDGFLNVLANKLQVSGDGSVKVNNQYTFPTGDASVSGYVLTSYADGTTVWASGGGGGGGTPDTPLSGVQFNDNGSFGAESNFTFSKAGSGILKVGTIVTNDADAGREGVVSIGSGAYSTRDDCVVIGRDSWTTSKNAVVIGAWNQASNADTSVAIGYDSYTRGNNSVAMGNGAVAYTDTVSIGFDANGSNRSATRSTFINSAQPHDNNASSSVAIGYRAWSRGPKSVSIGHEVNYSISAHDGNDVAIGNFTKSEAYGIAFGYQASAPTSGLVIGAAADNSILSGLFNSSSSATNGYLLTSTKFGINRTSAPDAMLDVTNQAATDVGAIIQGAASQTADLTQWQNSAGTTLASMGLNTANDAATMILSGTIVTNTGDLSYTNPVSIGSGAYVGGNWSIAMGNNAKANALQSIAIGRLAQATAQYGVAVGGSASASEHGAAFGQSASASTQGTAIGVSVTAGTHAVAVGYSAGANQHCATSVGHNSQSYGQYSAAVGCASAAGDRSVAMGLHAHADPTMSIAIGNYQYPTESGLCIGMTSSTTAAGRYSMFSGLFNSSKTATNGFLNIFENKLQVSGDGSVKVNNQYTFPTGDASVSGHVLTSYADGTTVWAATTGGSSSSGPDGSDTYVQFNDGGSFGGESNFTFSKAGSGILKVGTIVTNDADAAHIGVVSIGSGAYAVDDPSVGADGAVAIGRGAKAPSNSVAIGRDADGGSRETVAIGYSTYAYGQHSTAIGYDCQTNGSYAAAIGHTAVAESRAYAIGKSITSQRHGIGIGNFVNVPESGFVIGNCESSPNAILSGLFNSSSASTNGYLLTSTKFGINRTSTPDAMLDVTNQAATDVGAIIQGAASQTADLTQWQNSAGTTLASMGMTTFNDRATLMVSGTIVSNVADASRDAVVSIGSGTYCGDHRSVAIGHYSWTNAYEYAVSIGHYCRAGYSCVAIGDQSKAEGTSQGSVAIGSWARTYTNPASVAIGFYADVSAQEGVAIGAHAEASASNATAVGTDAEAAGSIATAIGQGTRANGESAVALGHGSTAATRSVAIGRFANAPTSGFVVVADGHSSSADSNNSILSGLHNYTSSSTNGNLHILNNKLVVSGDGSVKVNNQYTFPTGDASSSGHVLTSYADGTTVWAAASGGSSGSTNSATPSSGLQFNDGSNGFAASTGMLYDSTLNSLHLNSLSALATGDFQMKFTASGVGTTAVDLNVLDRVGSVSGTTLSFEGTEGQLFAIEDNLSSGSIFSVSDIAGLPLIEADASGDVSLAKYGRYVSVSHTGAPEYQLDVAGGTGNFTTVKTSSVTGVSAIEFADGSTQTTAPAGGGTVATGVVSGIAFFHNAGQVRSIDNFAFNSGNDPQVEFKGTGVGTTNVNLAILDRVGSTSGTTLSFEGSDGQLLGIVDNLASGTIFSVADIAGLPIMEADASGDVKLTAYGRNVGVAMTGTPAYQLDVYGTGNFASGVRFPDGNVQTIAYTGGAGSSGPDGSDTYVQFNDGGSAFGGESNFTFTKAGSGILKVGTIIADVSDAVSYPENVAVGSGARASYTKCVAVGGITTATYTLSTAVGYNADATNYGSVALGSNSVANGEAGTAMGHGAYAVGTRTVAIGYLATANGERSITIGESANDNSNTYTVCIGYAARSHGTRSVAVGRSAHASAYSVALGCQANAPTSGLVIGAAADNSILSGSFNTSAASTNGYLLTSTKFGINRTSTPDAMLDVTNFAATDVGAIIQGAASQSADLTQWQNSAGTTVASVGMTTANDATALLLSNGSVVSNTGDYARSLAGGMYYGGNLISIGSGSMAAADNTIAIGTLASAEGPYSVALGWRAETKAASSYGVSIGFDSDAQADRSIAIGNNAMASQTTVAIGYGAGHSSYTASTRSVFINSARSLADHAYSCVAIGYDSRAGGPYSVSLGHKTNHSNSAHDGNDVCIGNYTESDAYAIAIGYQANAPTSGLAVTAGAGNSILSGQFNSSTSHTDGFLNILANKLQVSGDGSVKVNNQYTFPTGVTASNDYVLTAQTDGSTAWASAGGGSPGGSDTQIQFNAGGTTFAGDNALVWNSGTNVLTISGHLAATTKSFLIDHPTIPEKKLQYACLEGPENGVYVRGHTNDNIIDLPDYWSSLVDEESITVQVTAKDAPQPYLYVSGVLNNKVYLISDRSVSAYYTINGTRKDVEPLEVEI